MTNAKEEARKNEIAMKLTELAKEESTFLINRPPDRPINWPEYLKRIEEIDTQRRELRKEMLDLCSAA